MMALNVCAQTERTIYVDFGQNNVSGQGFLTDKDSNGNQWNNVHGRDKGAPDHAWALTQVDLVASDGAATGMKLRLGTTFMTNGYGNGGLQNPKASLLGDLAIESATQDYIFLEGAQDHGVIHLTGLKTDKAYRFHLFGSRTSDDARTAYLTLAGETSWTGILQMGGSGIGDGGYNGNNNKIAVSEPIFADANGHMTLTMSKKTAGAMVYLNCMKIEEVGGMERPHQDLTLKQKFYIDFGETNNDSRGHQTTGADANGNYWNNFSSGSSSSNAVSAKTLTLKNSANQTSAIKLVTTTTQYTNGVTNGGNNNPDAELLGDLAIKTATEDYVFIDNGDQRPFTLKGLDAACQYRISIYGTRNHTDNRITSYKLVGQQTWEGAQTTSGYNTGGDGYNGNLSNILVSDLLYPDANGQIVINFQRQTGMAHISAMKVEELQGGERPADPIAFKSINLKGNAEDVTLNSVGSNRYEGYARLEVGTFSLVGTTADGDIDLKSKGDGHWVANETAEYAPFQVKEACVARITVDAARQMVEILPVTMHVRGNIAAGNPEIKYLGQGVWESEVTLKETLSQQWVDKTMYFALNNQNEMAIKRLRGNSNRYTLGMAELGQSLEDIYQNAGTYTITVDLVKMKYKISAPIDENRVSVFGSSVANGQGAQDYKGYRYLYGQSLVERYKSGLSADSMYTSNVSIGGNTTQNLLDRYDDLIRDFGRYVIFGLSLGNEGIHGASNQEGVFAQWRDNMLKLISKVRADGKIPVVMNNYTRADYDQSDYSYVKKLNLLIHEWDVPSFNCLGAIDKGNGQWADGYVSDTYHQNTAGHYEFFYCMVPSLFDALKAGKAQPKRAMSKHMVLGADSAICFRPEGTVHPFTITVRGRGSKGQLLWARTSKGTLVISIGNDGLVTVTTPTGKTITSSTTVSESANHYITLTSYYAQKRTLLYIDATLTGELSERLGELYEVQVGGAERDMSEIFFWRSAMTKDEITALRGGKMLKSSLELYVPLTGAESLANLAQSTNKVWVARAQHGTKFVKTVGDDVTFSGETGNGGFSLAENFYSVLDNDLATKWCLNVGSGVSMIFHANKPVRLGGYSITTGNDCAQFTGRNPKTWKLYGSRDAGGVNDADTKWELLASMPTDMKLKDSNNMVAEYTIPSTHQQAYQTFKWEITARKGGGDGVLQVAEFTPLVLDGYTSVPVTIVPDGSSEGTAADLLDDNTDTSWKPAMEKGTAWVDFHTSAPVRIHGYEITTAADASQHAGCNPTNWQLFGLCDGKWQLIYSVTNDETMQQVDKTAYRYMGDAAYRDYQYFRWQVTGAKGAPLQVSEFNLFVLEHRLPAGYDETGIAVLDDEASTLARSTAMYDLQGRRLLVRPQRGMVIQNGKKVLF